MTQSWSFSPGTHIPLQNKKKLAHPTRFERVTFAFGGQGSRHGEGKRDRARNAGGREGEGGADLGEDEADAAWTNAFALDAGLFT